MAQGSSFEFKPGSINTNLKRFNGNVNALVAGVVVYRADKAVSYMKTGAKWKDRTGNARATLAAFSLHGDDFHEIHLHGGVAYQIWLEVRWAGRLAIIGPAVKYQGLALMNQLRGLLGKLGRL